MLGLTNFTPLNLVIPTAPARAIAKHLGIETVAGLLEYYPRKYLQYGTGDALDGVLPDDTISFIGNVESVRTITTSKRPIFKAVITDGYQTIEASFFGAKYAPRVLKPGVRAMFTGKVKFFRDQPQMQHPDFMILSTPGTPQAGNNKGASTGSIKKLSDFGDPDDLLAGRDYLPVYPATKNLSTWTIMGAISMVLDTIEEIPEPLGYTPSGLLSLHEAINQIHNPSEQGPHAALERLKYNEAMSVALVMAMRRRDDSYRQATPLPRKPDGDVVHMVEHLPFKLTAGQTQVLEEISADLERTIPMSRLLQGEVGSGKTIVALAAMLQAVDNGMQCALLAPTEVLTLQHEKSLRKTLMQTGVHARVVALTGSMSTVQKQEALLAIMTGEADIVVGTHAIIQDLVEFFNLGFVVVDEQHRFGVEQRNRLRDKAGENTLHLLVMTATPIPRTIAMTVFGDLAVSTLSELPGGRKPIQSAVVPEFKRTWVDRAWEKIKEEIYSGHQAYIVCPRIEGPGGVLEVADTLEAHQLQGLTIGVLHGRMKGEEKDRVMSAFAAGTIDVLVSTTVIEVGVDVPNATVMMVRESEHFGVSQLHQLRGRVGRGGHASLCLFHTFAEQGSPQLERVTRIAEISDGFQLAELDLETRSEGDVLGTSQSGTDRHLRLLNLVQDFEIIQRAYDDAAEFVESAPERAREIVEDLFLDPFDYLNKS